MMSRWQEARRAVIGRHSAGVPPASRDGSILGMPEQVRLTASDKARKSGSHVTRRWREMDSNPRSPREDEPRKVRWILSQRRIAKLRTTTDPLVEEGGFELLGRRPPGARFARHRGAGADASV